MKDISVNNVFRWMLAAWMLLATSITSSTFVHGHSGGNVPHQHDGSDCTLPHSFQPTSFYGGHDDDARVCVVDLHRHGCLTLLGAIASLPTPGEPTGSHGRAPSGWETILAVSAVQSVRTLSKGVALDHCWLESFANFSVGCISPAEQREIPSSGVAVASPLCDRARHERSGVQLT